MENIYGDGIDRAYIVWDFRWISDGFLTYAPNGKVDLTNFKDYEKSKVAFHGMPLKNLSVAMLLGVCAMTLEIFGYIALCDWMQQYFLLLL